jgi:site-specific recombinase XerD
MKLAKLVSKFIDFKRSLGMRYETSGFILRSFCRRMGNIDVKEVQPCQVQAFLTGQGAPTLTWIRKFSTLRRFYDYAIPRGYAAHSPLPTVMKPKSPKRFEAYIYSTEELRRLLAATARLKTPTCPHRGEVFRMLLLLLYGTGLRRGEAVSLTMADVNLHDSLLTIRESKFFKSRLVPIGPRLTMELAAYIHRRKRWPFPQGPDAALLVSNAGAPLHPRLAVLYFDKLRDWAGIHRDDGASYQPRLHDLRHTFAVHRLVHWYRQGADVQRVLPSLSTYLGHRQLSDTQHYLKLTPELLHEASKRFEAYAFGEVAHV